MNLRVASIVAFGLMLLGIASMYRSGALFGDNAVWIAVQIAAVGLMLWARMTFGSRSFHAAADPTRGGLVTSGPYRYLRHPIYAAVTYFVWAGAFDHRTLMAIGGALLVTAGAALRMLAEEHLLVAMYPEYGDYKARTARVVPYVL